MRRAFADTKMTGCALLLEVFPTDRPRRSDRIFLLYAFLPSKLATDSLAWEMSLGVAPAVTRPATKNGVWMNPNPVMMVQEFLHQTVF